MTLSVCLLLKESALSAPSSHKKCPRCGVNEVTTKSTYCKTCNVEYESGRRTGTNRTLRTCVRCSAVFARVRDVRLCDACRADGFERSCRGCEVVFHARHAREWKCYDCRAAESKKYYNENVAAKRRNLVFGLPPGTIESMEEDQAGRCLTCGAPMEKFHVDHDRKCCNFTPTMSRKACGRCVRGLLCRGCNVGLGHFKDDPDLLLAAAAYLLRRTEAKAEV